jgi:hypothetical protein
MNTAPNFPAYYSRCRGKVWQAKGSHSSMPKGKLSSICEVAS